MRHLLLAIALLGAIGYLGAIGSTPALAVQPDEILSDPALEARARGLSAQLRCMVCQNQSIDDSDASLARDIRVLVREHLTAGESDAQIIDYLVQRYGAFILLKPPLEAGTILLWGTPFLVLILGAGAIVYASRRDKRSDQPDIPLNDVERRRLEALVADGDGRSSQGPTPVA